MRLAAVFAEWQTDINDVEQKKDQKDDRGCDMKK
jgi:hypothetical protein